MIAPGGRDGAPDREHDPLRVLPLDGVAAVFGDVPAAVARKAGHLRRRVLLAARPIVQRYRPSVNHQRAEEARLRRSKLLADRLRERPPGHARRVQAEHLAHLIDLPPEGGDGGRRPLGGVAAEFAPHWVRPAQVCPHQVEVAQVSATQ